MHIDRMTLARARLALREAVRGWLFDPNVSLIDFGCPEEEGQIDWSDARIRIHVRQKFPEGPELEAATERGITRGTIPDTIGGFKTDVPQGIYQPHWWSWWGRRRRRTNPRTRRVDPMSGGVSISDAYHNAFGTLSGLAVDRTTGDEMLLSNWHVLVGDWRVPTGRRVYQPGRRDGGSRADTVGIYARDAMSADIDAAVARLTGSRELINDQLDLGPVTGTGWANIGTRVVKSGRRTGITRGRVTAIEGTIKINYRGIDRIIRRVVTIEPHQSFGQVSAGGDSGSLWLEEATMEAVGLHFAGSDRPERALAIDMPAVEDALDVDLVTT